MATDVPPQAQQDNCARNKPSLLERLRRRWRAACDWLERADLTRVIGGSDVFK